MRGAFSQTLRFAIPPLFPFVIVRSSAEFQVRFRVRPFQVFSSSGRKKRRKTGRKRDTEQKGRERGGKHAFFPTIAESVVILVHFTCSIFSPLLGAGPTERAKVIIIFYSLRILRKQTNFCGGNILKGTVSRAPIFGDPCLDWDKSLIILPKYLSRIKFESEEERRKRKKGKRKVLQKSRDSAYLLTSRYPLRRRLFFNSQNTTFMSSA